MIEPNILRQISEAAILNKRNYAARRACASPRHSEIGVA